MQPLLAYLLKFSCCLSCGYLFYYLLLRHMTYYNWNRFFLLLFPVLAICIPFLPLNFLADTRSFDPVFFITGKSPVSAYAKSATGPVAGGWNMETPVLWIIATGILFFVAKFVIRFYSLQKARKPATLVAGTEIKLYHLEGESAPFSFYNSIYINTSLYPEQDLEKIIEHELVHINQKHTIDILLAEFVCIVQWYNPFAWLHKQAIRQNLEFIADDMVLQKGVGRKSYQYLLLKVSGAVPYKLANNLLFPSLKKRIEMMNKARTGKTHLLKFICLVPLICLLSVGFSGPTGKIATELNNSTVNNAPSFQLSSLSFYINDARAADIVKNEESKSFLKPGKPLSLSLISKEKNRLKNLLEKNGFDNLNNHAITFVMDTSATNQSFSVQVTINLPQIKNSITVTDKNKESINPKRETVAGTEPLQKISSAVKSEKFRNNEPGNPPGSLPNIAGIAKP